MLPPIPNGVPVDKLGAVHARKCRYALMLARVCPEKGLHLALQAAHAAGSAAADRRRDLPLSGAPGVFRRARSRRCSTGSAAISARSASPASAACWPARAACWCPSLVHGDQLAGGDGGGELRHAGDRVPQRRAAGGGRARADRLPGRRRRRAWRRRSAASARSTRQICRAGGARAVLAGAHDRRLSRPLPRTAGQEVTPAA